jgi:hypothetical protein
LESCRDELNLIDGFSNHSSRVEVAKRMRMLEADRVWLWGQDS